MRALTRAEVDDQATEKVNRITQKIKDLTKKVFSPVIKLRDLTASTVGKIKQRLKEIEWSSYHELNSNSKTNDGY